MLLSLRHLFGYEVTGHDGVLGFIVDALADHECWAIHHLVVDTGRWLSGKKVLINPQLLGEVEPTSRMVTAPLQRKLMEHTAAKNATPLVEQHEAKVLGYQGWEPSFNGPFAARSGPGIALSGVTAEPVHNPPQETTAAHANQLCSLKTLLAYDVALEAENSVTIEDFIVNVAEWSLPFIVTSTTKWLPGRKRMVPTAFIKTIDWQERTVLLSIRRENYEECPDYDPSAPINGVPEIQHYDFHGQPVSGPDNG